jgi:hypothetical protein
MQLESKLIGRALTHAFINFNAILDLSTPTKMKR